jgi:hypothetical protein
MKIPTGWRKLEKGTRIKDGDKFYSPINRHWDNSFYTNLHVGWNAGAFRRPITYIRRIHRKKSK